jgi:rhamnogalacturonyl hydrolase YesR
MANEKTADEELKGMRQMSEEEAREVVKWTKTEDAKLWHAALEEEALWTDGPYEWFCALDRLMYVD